MGEGLGCGQGTPTGGGPRTEPEQEGFTGWTIKGNSIGKSEEE